MKTEKEYLYDFLGRPEDHEFDIEAYKGRYGGLLNPLGLKHRGLIITGSTLFRMICEYYEVKLDRWTFMYELREWCEAYVEHEEYEVGRKGTIIRGQVVWGKQRYFCVPTTANVQQIINS